MRGTVGVTDIEGMDTMVESKPRSQSVSWELAYLKEAFLEEGVPLETIERAIDRVVVEPITLTEAADRFGIARQRLMMWVHRKHLREVGRLHGPGPGGILLVDANQVKYLVENPPKEGRPFKQGA